MWTAVFRLHSKFGEFVINNWSEVKNFCLQYHTISQISLLSHYHDLRHKKKRKIDFRNCIKVVQKHHYFFLGVVSYYGLPLKILNDTF